MKTLRGRLLGSYVLVVGLCLTIIALALFVILRRSPLPDRQTYQHLTDIARTSQITLDAEDPDTLYSQLARVAEAHEIRTLVVTRDAQALFDSDGQLAAGSSVNFEGAARLARGGQGTFSGPDGREWLYVAALQRRGPMAGPRAGGVAGDNLVLFATPRRTLPAFALFGINLLRPLVQAGVIACFASIILAAVISGSVARPLQRIAQAARDIARGDYAQVAPESGPDEVREVAQAFNHMAARVKQSQETQRDFLANVSHELKTPLTSIQGFSQAILDGAEKDPANAARVIRSEAGRMRRMVEELLDLARIESGQVVMARQHVDLTAVINAVVERLSLRAAERDVRLTTDLPQLPGITGDGDRLAQVFTNLIDNALDHTPPGGEVGVEATHADSRLRVAVSDSGPGIPSADLSRIFERFYQVDKSRARDGDGKTRGVGLGLTITKEIVEAHGGSIRAESGSGQGATFTVWLPLPRASDSTVARRR